MFLRKSIVRMLFFLLGYFAPTVWPFSFSSVTRTVTLEQRNSGLSLSKKGSDEVGKKEDKQGNSRIVIVGGGVGGLAIACRIASRFQTCEVVVLEKNAEAGGRMGSFDVEVEGIGTFRHERGPSLLLLPHVYQALFHDAKKGTAEEYGISMKQCSPAYQVVFDDGDRINVGFDRSDPETQQLEEESRRMMDNFEANGAQKWDEYMDICEAFLDCGLPNFIEERLDLQSFPSFLSAALGGFGKAWPLKPLSDVLDSIFSSNKMKALASFQDLYVGLEPFANKDLPFGGVLDTTAPAVFGLLSAIELHPTNEKCGVFAPLGGFRSVTNGIESLARDLGVVIKPHTTATKVTSEGVYCCDTSDTTKKWFEPADHTIVNADLPYAKKSLINEDQNFDGNPHYDWDESYRFSCGVLAFHWSFTKSLDDLNTHNVFMSVKSRKDAEKSWDVIRGSNDFDLSESPFNFYVHRASKTDPSAAPKGADSILVLVPCPTLSRLTNSAAMNRDEAIQIYKSQFDDNLISTVRKSVLRRLGVIDSLKDIEHCLEHEVVDTPATYADRYNVGAGTPFALSHGFGQLSLTRPGPFSSNIPNVCFCGASSRPGNGVPLVLVGAKLVADRIESLVSSIGH